MKRRLKISVVLPVYNGERYIAESIKSVQAQTYDQWELIVVDDGSQDATARIVQKYVESDQRIFLVSQKNQGVSVARNRGIEEITGELLMFLDADDWFERTAFEKVIHHWDDSVQMLLFDYYDVPGKGNKQYRKHFKEDRIVFGLDEGHSMDELILTISGYYPTYKMGILSAPWGKVWKRDLIQKKELKFPENIFAKEDQIFDINVCCEIEKALYVSEAIYNYRMNIASVTYEMYQKSGERLISNTIACNRYIRYAFNQKNSTLYEKAYVKYVYEGVKVILWWLAEEQSKDKKMLGRTYCYEQAKRVRAHLCQDYSIADKTLLLFCEKKVFWMVEGVVRLRRRGKRLLQLR